MAYTRYDGENVYDFMRKHKRPPSADELIIDAIEFLSDIDGEVLVGMQTFDEQERYDDPEFGCSVYWDGTYWRSNEGRMMDKDEDK